MEWRDIAANVVDFEANPISKRAGAAVRKLASPRRVSQIKNGPGVWKLSTLGQIADLGPVHWLRCHNVGPLGVEVIKWALDEAAAGRCPYLPGHGMPAVDAYVPQPRDLL